MTHGGKNHDLPLLSGPSPGLLDPSQPSRLLRTPTCSLFFAAFDPLTARSDGFPNISALHINSGSSSKPHITGTNGKRIVIETDPERGTCSWRFVPRARMDGDPTLDDDGPWPRVVELCGHLVRMTQDQWDIHRLDPQYDCIVRASPNVAQIMHVTSKIDAIKADTTPSTPHPLNTPKTTAAPLDDVNSTPKAKRHISHPRQEFSSPHKRKKVSSSSSSSQDSDRMAVDEDVFYTPPPPSKSTSLGVPNGKKRRRVSVHLEESQPGNTQQRPSGKRTGSSVFTELSPNPGTRNIDDTEVSQTPAKKARTRSPDAVRREMEQKRAEREKKRKADMEMRVRERRYANHIAFWKEIGVIPTFDEDFDLSESEAGASETEAEGEEQSNPGDSAEEHGDDEAERLSKIEDSRRKLAELEKDKPLWEESARKRHEREAEEERMRQREEAMRKEEDRRQERVSAARKQQEERWQQERRERDREARMKEQSGRMFVFAPRSTFRWSARLSLERYVRTAADFDVAKFSSGGKPMTFEAVPWPMLRASFSVQDVDWDAVEAFFKEVQILLKPEEFKGLVEKSHRRFHPDRWRSRGLLVSVKNETERDLLEVAGSTVAQAITPLWKEVTGR